MLTAILSFEVNAQSGDFVKRVNGEHCPDGSRHITFEEARGQGICELLDEWDIAKIGGGGSMRGPSYRCEVTQNETKQSGFGHSLCVSDTSPTSRRRQLIAGANSPRIQEFVELFEAASASEPGIILSLFPVERLYKAWQMGEREKFKQLLIDPYHDIKIPFTNFKVHVPIHTGIFEPVAEWITDQLFPKESNWATMNNHCAHHNRDAILIRWIETNKFPLDPWVDYQLITWIHQHPDLVPHYPKLTSSIGDMLSDNPTRRIEAQWRAFLLLLQDHIKQFSSEEYLRELLSKTKPGAIPQVLLQQLAGSLYIDEQALKDFLHQFGQTIEQQGQKNRQAFEGKYKLKSEGIKQLFASNEVVRQLVVKEKGTKKILSEITIAQDPKAFALIMQEKHISLVWSVKNVNDKIHLGLMINGQPIEHTLAKYRPNKDPDEVRSVLDPLQKSIKSLVNTIDKGSSAEQKQQAYKRLEESVRDTNRALFCPPHNGRHLEGGDEAGNDESCNVTAEPPNIPNSISASNLNGQHLQEGEIEIEEVNNGAFDTGNARHGNDGTSPDQILDNPLRSDTGRNSDANLILHPNNTLEQAIYEELRVADPNLRLRHELVVSEDGKVFYVRSCGNGGNQIGDSVGFRVNTNYVNLGELEIPDGVYRLEIDAEAVTIPTCTICFGYLQEEARRILRCRHNQFHPDCINQWLKQSVQCPICKKVVVNPPQQRQAHRQPALNEEPPCEECANGVSACCFIAVYCTGAFIFIADLFGYMPPYFFK
jgi:hypothetical protein